MAEGYDMKSFTGRLQYFATLCSPRHMFTTDADIEDARTFLKSREGREPLVLPPVGEAPQSAGEFAAVNEAKKVEKAQFILCGSTHPAENETIAMPFRMGSWVALGTIPVSGLMLTAMHYPTSLLRIGAWQWFNQSINATINYYNGAALAEGDDARNVFLEGYFGACFAAVGIGIGMGKAIANIPALKGVQQYAPYPAVVCVFLGVFVL